jgi:hypothetical protein
MNRFFSFTVFLVVLFVGCSTTKKSTDNTDESSGETTDETRQPIFDVDPEVVEAYLTEEMDEFDRLLFENRSTLSDQFANIEHDMPEAYMKEFVVTDQMVDQYAGFRVQLLSTRSVVEADSTKDNFRAWADENIKGYSPEAYVTFRQPYYKVRVGDFRDQQKANNFSRMLKEEYPAAWVVHDRIEPEFLPADTTRIEFVNP